MSLIRAHTGYRVEVLAYAAGLLIGTVIGALFLVVEWTTNHRRKKALRRFIDSATAK